MSIASQITALTTDRNAIRAALVNQGVTAASTHGFDDFATDINNLSPIPAITETQDSHGGTILDIRAIDYTSDTVAPDKLLAGYTAHDSTGAAITGSYVPPFIPVVEKDVNFIDYDGTLLYSYTATEFASLTEMPANPTHTGLISQGWNWDLSEAKAYVAKYTDLDIGQMYITNDGKSRFYITIDDASRRSLRIAFGVEGSVTIDWGDGSSSETITDSIRTDTHFVDHTYAAIGDYVISLETGTSNVYLGQYESGENTKGQFLQPPTGYWPSGTIYTTGRCSEYTNMLKKVEMGTACQYSTSGSFIKYTFYRCFNLETITLPDVSSFVNPYGDYYFGLCSFMSCTKLKAMVLPKGYTYIYEQQFQRCTALERISMPNTVKYFGAYAFLLCASLDRLTLSGNLSTVSIYALSQTGLKKITIPENVTQLNYNVLSSNSNLQEVYIMSNKLTMFSYSMFYEDYTLRTLDLSNIPAGSSTSELCEYCYSLESVILPDSMTSLSSYIFNRCEALTSVHLPNQLQSMSTYTFAYCASLYSITIPASVVSIGNNSFYCCYNLHEIHFLPTTPPTLGGGSVFSNVPAGCKIYVPSGSLSAYTSATNYPSSSTYTYIEE